MQLAQMWTVGLWRDDGGVVHSHLTHFDVATETGLGSYESSGSSSVVFQELLTVLDATIFTSLAIDEGVLPEGQLPLT